MSDTPLQAAIRAAFNTKANQTALDSVRDELRALEGYLLNFTTDSTVAYSKSIPANSFDYAAVNSFGGRSLAWNQLVPTTHASSVRLGVTFTNNGDGSWTVNGTATDNAWGEIATGLTVIAGHKYLLFGCPSGGSTSTYALKYDSLGWYDFGNGVIATASSDSSSTVFFRVFPGVTVTNEVVYPQLIDLTLMFGAGNEPSTVEEFKAIFPDDYYAYSAGEIKSAGVNKIVSKDSNSDVLAEMNIPAEILALPGYGWSAGTAYNEIDWENKKYIQRVSSQTITGAIGDTVTLTGAAASAQYICALGDIGSVSSGVLTLTAAVTDETIYFELETPIETDISALLDDNHIKVESGGTITFENSLGDSYRIPVPSTVLTAQQGA
jgi:hypothetical protein